MKPDYIKEQTAAEIMGLKPRTLRLYVKNGVYNVLYTTRPSGRGFEYDRNGLLKIKEQNSNKNFLKFFV